METTFLQLCKDTRQEAGIQGTGPASVTTAIGVEKKIVDWVRAAWMKIQRKRTDWLFMRVPFEFTVVTGQSSYPFVSTEGLQGLSAILRERVSAYSVSGGRAGEYVLPRIDFERYRQLYDMGEPVSAKPAAYCFDPSGTVLIGPVPDADYVVRGYGRRSVQRLTENGDIILLSNEYVDAIKWLALKLYAGHEEAGNIYQHADNEYDAVMRRMEMELLPQFSNYTEPLA